MNAIYGLGMVFVLVLAALLGVGALGLQSLIGVYLPYVAVAIFVIGVAARVFGWARSPVPFRIPTTAGQQLSAIPEIKQNKFDNPTTTRDVIVRMLLEVFCFRSLFRNTKTELEKDYDGEPSLTYASAKWLWLFGILFHYSFLVVVIRHMRFFTEPIPQMIGFVELIDSMLQIGAPTLYLTDLALIGALLFLFLRRVVSPQINYISLVADYFPLALILAIALSGVYMRYVARIDVMAVKELTMGLVRFKPVLPANIDVSFYIHLFLVSVLLIYFPFSKLMHLGGVFLSPTRNLANTSRMKHHENPWNPKLPPHSYEAYEDEFREPMIEAGLPVEKTE